MTNSAGFHEDPSELSPATRDKHRALVSLMEELEAVDWYAQRVEATQDEELKAILAHNRDEEIEHAAMVLEWLRRNDASFGRELSERLFQDGPIIGHGNDTEDAPTDLGVGSLKPSHEDLAR